MPNTNCLVLHYACPAKVDNKYFSLNHKNPEWHMERGGSIDLQFILQYRTFVLDGFACIASIG